MLRPDGYVKVLDFGLAKLTEQESSAGNTDARTLEQLDTQPGMVLGTAKYMSPEQARGLKVDGRSDIFSLGVLLYEMVTGRRRLKKHHQRPVASILKIDRANWYWEEAERTTTDHKRGYVKRCGGSLPDAAICSWT
jgi:serine/threonine protein kinase